VIFYLKCAAYKSTYLLIYLLTKSPPLTGAQLLGTGDNNRIDIIRYVYAVIMSDCLGGALTNNAEEMMLSDVCLSVAYTGPKWRINRPKKTSIGIEVARVTGGSDTTLKVKRSNDKVLEAGLTVVASPSPYNLLYYAHAPNGRRM